MSEITQEALAFGAPLRHTDEVIRHALLVLIAVLGCGSQPKQPAPTPSAVAADDPSCPLLVAGTAVSVEDADQGVALVFVTTGEVPDVRKRTVALAAMHNAHHFETADPHAAHGAMGGMGTMVSTRSAAAVSDVQGGARITFTAASGDRGCDLACAVARTVPVSPETVSALLAEVRMHAQHLTGASSCEMKM